MHYETWNAGVLGPITLKGLNEGTRDLSKQSWSYKVCMIPSPKKYYHVSGSRLIYIELIIMVKKWEEDISKFN